MGSFFRKKDNCFFLTIIAALIAVISWQESQIADLQERMMQVEAARYDDAVTNLQWHAWKTDDRLKEMEQDIYHIQKHSTDHDWRIMEMEWDVYGK